MTYYMPTIQKPCHPVRPTLHFLHTYKNNTCFGIALHYLAHASFQEKCTNQIAALSTTPE